MDNYLLYNKGSSASARALAKLLGIKASSKLLVNPPIIRYGNSDNPLSIDTQVNSPESIKLCSNSIQFSQFCQEKGFTSPIYTPLTQVDEIETFPCLIRKKYHRSGLDIHIINSIEEYESFVHEHGRRGFYHVPFIKTEYEIRVHVINGEVVRLFRKVHADEENNFIRSASFGWGYSLRSTRYSKAKELAVSLATALDIYFVALDMAWNKSEKEYCIWEANSGPGLNTETLNIYAQCLSEVL